MAYTEQLQDTPEALWKLLCDCASFEPPKRPEFKEVAKRLKALLDTMPKDEDDVGDPADDSVDYADEPAGKDEGSSDEEEEETIETTRSVVIVKSITEMHRSLISSCLAATLHEVRRSLRSPRPSSVLSESPNSFTSNAPFPRSPLGVLELTCSLLVLSQPIAYDGHRTKLIKTLLWPTTVNINNQTSKDLKSCRIFVQQTQLTGKKTKTTRTKQVDVSDGTFPIKAMTQIEKSK